MRGTKTIYNLMEVLRQELKIVSEKAPKGSHKIVAKAVGYSEQYIGQVRNGTNAVNDTPENRKLIERCILVYRELIRDKIKELKEQIV